MASITIRNVPDEVHRALRVRAARHGRSAEAELRDILEMAARPAGRLKLGSLLTSIASYDWELSDAEIKRLDDLRDRATAEPIRFE